MQREKIEALYRLLGCGNSDIARALDCSPSAISRVRSGSRNYSPSSRPVLNFAEGVCRYAGGAGCLDRLSELCGAPGQSRKELIPALIAWLFDEETGELPVFPVYEDRRPRRERLSEAMELLELSNMRLARRINVDASTVSRFRNGLRAPKPPISELLAEALLDRAEQLGKTRELAALCGGPDAESLSSWLWGGDVPGIDSLLDSLERLPGRRPDPPEDLEELPYSPKSLYWGAEGLREAVTRFLTGAVREGGELWLYSDQSMDWMVGDPSFQSRWASLMAACAASGVRIRVIHNVDRGFGEMLSAIQSWLPLYMSGMIEPWVCRLGRDFRFSRTIFLRPGAECIMSSQLRGREDRGRYEYLTDSRDLDFAAAEFMGLLQSCSPLIRVNLEGKPFEPSAGDRSLRLMSGLSLGTMPEETLESILDRHAASAEERRVMETARAERRRFLERFMSTGRVEEFITLPTEEALFRGRACVEPFCGRELYYTPEEFSSHIRAVLELMEGGYEAIVLPERPFTQLQLMVSETQATVIRTGDRRAAFTFSEPRMLRSFQEYFRVLKKRFRTGGGEQGMRRFL